MKRTLLLILIINILHLGFGQQKVIDSLKRVSLTNNSPKVLYLIAEEYIYQGAVDSAETYCIKAESIKPDNKLIVGYKVNAMLLYYKGELDSCVAFLNKVIPEHVERLTNRELISLYMIEGKCYSSLGNHSKAIECFNLAGKVALKTNDTNLLASTIGAEALELHYKGDFLQSVEKNKKALDLFHKTDNKYRIALCCNNMGISMQKLKRHEKAIDYFHQAIDVYKLYNDNVNEIKSLNNIGISLNAMGKQDSALLMYHEIIKKAQKHKFKEGLLLQYMNISDIYAENNNSDSLYKYTKLAEKLAVELNFTAELSIIKMGIAQYYLNKGNYDTGIRYLEESLKLNKQSGELHNRVTIYRILSEAYRAKNDYKKALLYHTEYAYLNDSLLNKSITKQIIEIETKYETEKKEQQLKLKKQENEAQRIQLKQQRIIIAVVIIFLFSIVTIFILAMRQRSQKHKQKLLELKIQTHDKTKHELFSTLHTALGGKFAATILKLENKLGNSEETQNIKELYRAIQTASHILALPDFVKSTIEDEINVLVANYKTNKLEIETSMHSKTAWKNIPPFVQQNIFRIVQELFSNTMKYAKADYIEMQLVQHNDYISLTYEDNGVGYNPQEIRKGKGYQYEIEQRIALLNGSYTDDSKLEQGAILTFKFPIGNE